jgi:hypothetical protein
MSWQILCAASSKVPGKPFAVTLPASRGTAAGSRADIDRQVLIRVWDESGEDVDAMLHKLMISGHLPQGGSAS